MDGVHWLSTSLLNISAMPGTTIHQMNSEPRVMIKAYFSPMINPRPSTAEPVLIFSTSFVFSAMVSPMGSTRVVNTSLHQPKVATMKSYRPPMRPAMSRGIACLPPLAPLTSTCVVAVASGKGYLPCMSFTKYLRKGIRNSMPRIPPSSDAKNTLRNDADISGYLSCRI